jgi:hypothetical protein
VTSIQARHHVLTPAALTLALIASGCVQPVPMASTAASAPLRVTNGGQPFQMWDGAPARQIAEAECAARGQNLRTSIYDRFEGGAWVFVEGCA